MKTRIQRTVSIVLALLLTLTSLALAQGIYTAGAYTAKAAGNMGDVEVEVVFDDDAIASVTILAQQETPSIAATALETIPAAIVAGQTLAVDAVAGATMTSNAILDAVKQCVAAAGGDIESLLVAREAEALPAAEETIDADIAIIGAGGAGLSAAITAAEQGANVVVIEKMPTAGGTTALSSGLIQVAGTVQQKAYGITEDNVDVFANDIYARGAELGNMEIIRNICENANETMDWLGKHGVTWQDTLFEKHGEDVTYLRTHAPVAPEGYTGTLGALITDSLVKDCANYENIRFLYETRAHALIKEDGKIIGVRATNENANTEYTVLAKAVIVATGGFAHNSVMAHAYNPNFPVENTDYRAFVGSLGEGIAMGEEVGAALADMQYMKILVSGAGVTSDITNAVYVNVEGNRFFNEGGKTELLTAAMNEQTDHHCFMVYDSRTVGEVTEKVQNMLDDGSLVAADTIAELAQKLGVNAENLDATIENFNAVVRGEAEDAFGRTKFENTIEVGPFYAAERHTRLHYTMGGLKIDKDTHVIDTEGAILPGLYAAGETTGGIHGSYRVGAFSLTEIFVMGRIAGITAAQEALGA